MKNKLAVFVFSLGFALSSASVLAQSNESPDEGHMMAYMPPPEEEFENLGLNADQKEKIKKIFDSNKPEINKNHKEVWQKMKSFREDYIDDKKSDAYITKAHSEIENLHAKIIKQNLVLEQEHEKIKGTIKINALF